MPYSAIAVGNTILDIARAEGRPVTPMQLIKLVYIAHGWHLAITDSPLITDQVQAWKFGPVISELYHEFKEFGREPIRRFGIESYRNEETMTVDPVMSTVPRSDVETRKIIADTWQIYGRFNGVALSELTHQRDTPWFEAWNVSKLNGKSSWPIQDAAIKQHYLDLASTAEQELEADAIGSSGE